MQPKTNRKNSQSRFLSNEVITAQRVIAYLRVSTTEQQVDGQKLAVLDHARKLGMVVDEFFEVEMSSRKDTVSRRIDELMEKLRQGDVLILSELSRFGRSLSEVVQAVNHLAARNVRIIVVKQGIDIQGGVQDMSSKVMVAMFSLMAELERDLISERTRMALSARRAAGVKLGRPKGVTGKSVLDDKKTAIEELLRHRVSKSAIARMMSVSKSTLHSFLNTRGICA
jgi:DNA invertase Pin-like site-specific DNA recombinase